MKRDRPGGRVWGRLLRQTAAFFLSAVALWTLWISAGAGKGLLAGKGASAALLAAEMGPLPGEGLTLWERLALEQSPLLLGLPVSPEEADLPEPEETGAPAGEEAAAQAEEGDDPQQLPAVTAAPDGIVPRTLTPSSPEGYTVSDGVYIFNRTDLLLDAGQLSDLPVSLTLEGCPEPEILIMHTHATEAYTPDASDVYLQTDSSRTLDTGCNMCRIGREMEAVFQGMGISVIRDETLYDYPKYSGAYTRSRAGVEAYLERYPSIKLVLDVHRDALIAEDGTVYKAVTDVDGVPTAQVLMVLGSPEGGDHPRWMENLALAMQIQKRLDTLYPTLARPITLRSARYNQDLTTGSLLVEVGCHGNTLQEAIRGGRLFAYAAGQVLLELRQDR